MIDSQRPSARLIGGAVVGLMVLGSAVGAEAATHKKAKKPVKVTRTVTLTYTGGCTVEAGVGASPQGDCASFGAAGWVLPLKKGEKYASVSVVDASGRAAAGSFWEPDGPNGTSTTTDFCGSLKDYVVPPTDTSVTIALDAVGVRTSCPGTVTQGTVKVVFSNLP